MDPQLLKEQKAFLRHAQSVPVIEQRPKAQPPPPSHVGSPALSSSSSSSTVKKSSADFDYKSSQMTIAALHGGNNTIRFEVLAKIVKYMMKRHLDGETQSLSLEEIVEEMHDPKISLTTLPKSVFVWLEQDALQNNPRIKAEVGGSGRPRFVYRPIYNIRNAKDLRSMLARYDMRGLGGIYKDDIMESLKNAEKSVQALRNEVLQITRPNDKKVVLYYNDPSLEVNIDEVFREHWRAISVESVSECKVEEYLKKMGILTISGERRAFIPAGKKQTSAFKRRRQLKLKDNEHVKDILVDYSSQS